MAIEIDLDVKAIEEIFISSNVPDKIVVFCFKGHSCVYVLMLFVGVSFFIMFYLSRTGKLDCVHC